VAVMQPGIEQQASDAELMVFVREVQEEIRAHSELNELNLLLLDFARELLKQRLLRRVAFLRVMKSSHPE
jgi:hypothetical protein